MEKKTIKFLMDCAPKDGSGTEYKEGERREMVLSSAEHWVKRGKAEYVDASQLDHTEGKAAKGQSAKGQAVEPKQTKDT